MFETSFERQALGLDRNQGRTKVYVTKRSDGKFKAVYCFSAKKLTKIRTPEKLKSDHDSGSYLLIGIDALEVI